MPRPFTTNGRKFLAYPLYEEEWATGRRRLNGWQVEKNGVIVGQYDTIDDAKFDLEDYGDPDPTERKIR